MIGQAIINHIDTILSNSNATEALEARIDQFAEERTFTLGPNGLFGMSFHCPYFRNSSC